MGPFNRRETEKLSRNCVKSQHFGISSSFLAACDKFATLPLTKTKMARRYIRAQAALRVQL
jgi:hypothetical protein